MFPLFFTNVVSLSLYMIQTRKLVQQRLYHLYFLAFVSLFLLVVECCSSRLKESEGLKELGLVGACKFCYDGSHGLFIPWQISFAFYLFILIIFLFLKIKIIISDVYYKMKLISKFGFFKYLKQISKRFLKNPIWLQWKKL